MSIGAPAHECARMQEVGFEVDPDKTRIVYCKDARRRAEHEQISFTLLRIRRRTDLSLDDLARWLSPIVAGWINY